MDAQLRQTSIDLGINYVSLVHILCDASGCLGRLGETAETVVAWDYGHLTKKGAEHLVSYFPGFKPTQ